METDDINEEQLLEERLGRSSPPPEVVQQNRKLYGYKRSPSPAEESEKTLPAPGHKEDEAAIDALGLSRLVRLLQARPSSLKIVVNGVGIHLPVIGWDLQPRTLLCFVTGDVRCDLPLTDDVLVHLPTHAIKATFVGQWHSVPWLPFQLVAFGIPEES